MENEGREATALAHALEVWKQGQELLIEAVEDGGLGVLDDLGFVGFLLDLERLRNRTSLIDHRVVRDAEIRRLPETWTQPNWPRSWSRCCGCRTAKRPAGSAPPSRSANGSP